MAQRFWAAAGSVKVFALHGAMGAGKTTTVAALCRHLGVQDDISSPTFSIINQYGYTQNGEQKIIYHIDLYRLEGEEEVYNSGVDDCINSGAVCFVEWPEKAPQLFDATALHIHITALDAHTRQLQILPASADKSFTLPEHL